MRASNPHEIRNLLVIWRETSFCLLNVPYMNPLSVDGDMLAALLRAIQHVAHDGLRMIRWERHSILFEMDENLLVVLVTKSNSNETLFRESLRVVTTSISSRIDEHPYWIEEIRMGKVKNSREIILDVLSTLPPRIIGEELTPIISGFGEHLCFDIGDFKTTRENICKYVDGKRTVQQIITESGYDKSIVLEFSPFSMPKDTSISLEYPVMVTYYP